VHDIFNHGSHIYVPMTWSTLESDIVTIPMLSAQTSEFQYADVRGRGSSVIRLVADAEGMVYVPRHPRRIHEDLSTVQAKLIRVHLYVDVLF